MTNTHNPNSHHMGQNKINNLIKRRAVHERIFAMSSVAGASLMALAISIMPTFNQLTNALTIGSLSQTSGPLAGGNEVTIKGDGFKKDEYYLGDKIKQVAGSGSSQFMVTDSGRIFAWGRNDNGQLGVGDKSGRSNPVEITNEFGGKKIVKIAIGSFSTWAIADDGSVYGFGMNNNQIMAKNFDWYLTPKLLNDVSLSGSKIVDVAPASNHVTYLTNDGRVYYAGVAASVPFNIGDDMGNSNGVYDGATFGGDRVPTDFTALFNGQKIAAISPSYVVTESGRVYAWGKDSQSATGMISNGRPVDITTKFNLSRNETVTDIRQSIIWNNDSIQLATFITNDGRVFITGSNKKGSIANGKADDNSYDITEITDKFSERPIRLTSPVSAITKSGDLYIWGTTQRGAAGLGQEVNQLYTPAVVDGKLDTTVEYRNTSENNGSNIRISQSGVITVAGNGYFGQIGDGREGSGADVNTYPIDISANFNGLSKKRVVDNVKSVKFGDTEASYRIVDGNTLIATVPKADKTGKVNVAIADSYGNTPTLDSAYEYMANETDANETSSAVDKDSTGNIIPLAPNTGARMHDYRF